MQEDTSMVRAGMFFLAMLAFAGRAWSQSGRAEFDPSKWNDQASNSKTHWSNPFPSLDGDVMAMATYGYILYVGGYFVTAGDVVVNHIAMWDGQQWSNLAGGTNRPVLALAVDREGNLYAGGVFSTAGGTPAPFIAKWDGARWSSMDGGMNNIVQSLAIDDDGTLYAGGGFTRAGTVEANYIARWSGDRWDRLGAGTDHNVLAIAPAGYGRLYAGGGFMMAGGRDAAQVAFWDGETWQPLGRGMNIPFSGRPVWALALDASGRLYAGGNFDAAGDGLSPFLSRWNGSKWTPLGTGVDGIVRALAVDAQGALYAGGYFTRAGDVAASRIARWKNGRWSVLESGTNDLVNALAIGDGDMLHVGGGFSQAGSTAARYLACWALSLASEIGEPAMPPREDRMGSLLAAYPNPFDVTATISFTLSESRHVTLKIFDMLGREQISVLDGVRSVGRHEVVVSASHLPGGHYAAVLDTGDSIQTVHLIVRR